MSSRFAFLSAPPPPRTALTVLAALLWAALPLVFSLPTAVVLLFTALLAVRGALLYVGIGKLPAPVLALLGVLSGVLVWTQLGTVFGREGGVAFLLLLVTLKAFESSSQRDWNVLLLAMLFLIGSAVLFNQSLLTGLWLLAALTAAAVCLAVSAGGLGLREALRCAASSLLAVLPLAAVLFVSVPRMKEPLWRIPQGGQQAKTGLSGTMQPGSISNLVQSDEWVANITFSDGLKPQPRDLYWRAIIMSDFDGTRWQAMPDFAADSAPQLRVSEGRGVRYQMIIRDQNGALPALDYPAGVLPQGLVRRLGGTVRAERSREGLRRLDLQAALGDTLPHALNEAEYRRYTRLPEGNPQTRRLAETLAKQSPTERAFIRNVLNHFSRRHFSYTLRPPTTAGRNSIDEFMFATRQGFCEHYAQSFAVIMRAAGLPARIVTGYQGAEYNPQGGFWQIRAKDAHAWTEVWLPSEQVWLRVDPTAAVAAVRTEQGIGSALPQNDRVLIADESAFSRWRDTGQFYWQQWVVNYDQSRQNSFFSLLGLGGFNLKTLLLFLPAALAAALLPLYRWQAKNRSRDHLEEGFMLLKLALLGDGGESAPSVTAAELKSLLHENGIQDDALETLLADYDNLRYAGLPSDPRAERRWYRAAVKTARRYRKR
jgi:transglutaminase family protein